MLELKSEKGIVVDGVKSLEAIPEQVRRRPVKAKAGFKAAAKVKPVKVVVSAGQMLAQLEAAKAKLEKGITLSNVEKALILEIVGKAVGLRRKLAEHVARRKAS